MNEIKIELGKFVLRMVGFVLLIAAGVFSAYTITVLWDWFIVVQFGIAHMTVPVALGIGIILQLYTKNFAKTEHDITVERVLGAFLIPAFALGIGYIYKGFM